jgi:hypothetical protein
VNLTITQLPAAVSFTVAVPGSISGPTGPQGPQGIQGPPGSSFTFAQTSPAAVWTIVHNLGLFPSVTVVDSAGTLIEGDLAFPDMNTVTVTFSAAFSGVACLV